MNTASWVVTRNDDGAVLFETFNATIVARLNTERYTATPILDRLQALNRRIKEQGQ